MGEKDIKGQFEALQNGMACGWALDCASNDPCSILILDSHNNLIASGTATIKRHDLQDKIAGFRIQLPEDILLSSNKELHIEVMGVTLPGKHKILPQYSVIRDFDGFINPRTLSGWIKNKKNSDLTYTIQLLHNGEIVTSVTNNGRINASEPHGRFFLNVPEDFNEETAAEYALFCPELDWQFITGQQLAESYAQTCEKFRQAEASAITGKLEAFHNGFVEGWAINPRSSEPVLVRIVDQDRKTIAQATTGLIRPDLQNRLAGFRFPLPAETLCKNGLNIHAEVDDTLLPGTYEINPSDSVCFCFDGFASRTTLTGWVKHRLTSDRTFTLQLMRGGELIAESENSARIDASDAHGRFNLEIPESLLTSDIYEFEIYCPELDCVLHKLTCHLSPAEDESHFLDKFPFMANAVTENTLHTQQHKRELAKQQEGQTKKSHIKKLLSEIALIGGDKPELLYSKLCQLAGAYKEDGQLADAQTTYLKAANLMPDEERAHMALLDLLYMAARESEAARYLESLPAKTRKSGVLQEFAHKLQPELKMKDGRVIAFYLPQFHPFPENDRWWGKGFTEWTNVVSAKPLFEGHVQPRKPGELGFYDLRLPETANAQFKLARESGIDGFCYYYYWFNGKKLMDRPLEDLASGKTGPFPFCICWANEDWTRSWDGASGEKLISQIHTLESDNDFIRDISGYLEHKDYIRYEGKPLLLVYRPEKMADPVKTTQSWRDYCREKGIGEIYLCSLHSFDFTSPRKLGFDAAIEFPPLCDNRTYKNEYFFREILDLKEKHPESAGKVYSYQHFSDAMLALPTPAYKKFHTSCLAWDNTARRGEDGVVFHQFTPLQHAKWLWRNIGKSMRGNGESLTFINAWNEWSEGSTLEPDAYWEHANLNFLHIIKSVLPYAAFDTFWKNGLWPTPRDLAPAEGIIIVGHNAQKGGAQINLLNLCRHLKNSMGHDLLIILQEGGPLLAAYERVAKTIVLSKDEMKEDMAKIAAEKKNNGFEYAICNSVGTGEAVKILASHGYKTASLVHELPALIKEYSYEANCWDISASAKKIIFASEKVAEPFCATYWPDRNKVAIHPQGFIPNPYHEQKKVIRDSLRKKLGLPEDALLVTGCGYADYRKGIDLFIALAARLRQMASPLKTSFLWIGDLHADFAPYIRNDLKRLGLHKDFHVTGFVGDPSQYFSASDIFAMTSREDPFPTVVMEAFSAGVPVVAFEGGGGYADIIPPEHGRLVPYTDVEGMARACLELVADAGVYAEMSEKVRNFASGNFTYERYAQDILAELTQRSAGKGKRNLKVSVIVPNYNYARYLELRLRTIADQTVKPYEIIVLDDNSHDSSGEIIEKFSADLEIPIIAIYNSANSGNVFSQWKKGLELARGDLVWIAEADDYCELDFLESLIDEFEDPEVTLAWCDSYMVDGYGNSSGAEYKHYYTDKVEGGSYFHDFKVNGKCLLQNGLLQQNIIPNASAVLFKKDAAKKLLADLTDYVYSGDWWFWAHLAMQGDAVYHATSRNYHRRHDKSVVSRHRKHPLEFMREFFKIHGEFNRNWPELYTTDVRMSLFQHLEKVYRLFPDLTAKSFFCRNNPDLKSEYEKLLKQLDSCPDTVKASGKRHVLILGGDFTRDAETFVEYLNESCSLALVMAADTDINQRLHGWMKDRHINFAILGTAKSSRLLESADDIYIYGLGAVTAILKDDQDIPGEYNIIFDNSYDTLLGKASPEISQKEILNFIKNSRNHYFTGHKSPLIVPRLMQSIRKIARRLDADALLSLNKMPAPEPVRKKLIYNY